MAEEKKEDDEISQMLSKIEAWNEQKRWSFITPKELGEKMKSIDGKKDKDVIQVIDVRHSDQDYIGGHVNGSTNIPYPTFKESLPHTLSTYSIKQNFIIHCMYWFTNDMFFLFNIGQY